MEIWQRNQNGLFPMNTKILSSITEYGLPDTCTLLVLLSTVQVLYKYCSYCTQYSAPVLACTVVNTKFFQSIYFCGTNHDVKIFMLNFPIAYFPPLTKLSTIFRSNDTTAFAKIWFVKWDSRMNFSSKMYCKYSIIKTFHA